MRDNRGVTLVELIVVITIIAVLTGGATMSLKYLSHANVDKVTERIDSSLSKLQAETISKAYPYGYLAIEWDVIDEAYKMYLVTSPIQLTQSNWTSVVKTIIYEKKLGDKDISITYSNQSDGTDQVTIGESNQVLLINFNPASGAFSSQCKQIVVGNGVKNSTIYLVSMTGNHYIE